MYYKLTGFTYFPPSSPSPLTASSSTIEQVAPAEVLRRHRVRIIGHGKPPLLLCNGFGYTQGLWQQMTTALAVHHQVILFDYVGAGAFDPQAYDEQKYNSLQGYADDVVELCRALDLREAVLVGHSVGATIAMLAAIAAPTHFRQVVLLTPSPCYLNEPGYYGGFERDNLQQVLEDMRNDYRTWAFDFADLIMGPSHGATLGQELARFFYETDARIAQQFARVTFFSDNRADVPQLQLPTLVVLSQDDVVAPAEVGEYLVRHLPQGQLVTLATTGHCPQLSAPLETLAVIRTFVDEPAEIFSKAA